MLQQTTKIGERGLLVIPAVLRKRFGLNEGSLVIAEEREYGILIRPASAMPMEISTPERIAEFLLNNSIDENHCQRQREEVKKMGLDPDTVSHDQPST